MWGGIEMKIRIITHYEVLNHGAILQLYSLKKVLERFSGGEEVKALKYKKNFDFMEENIENKYVISLKSVPYYMGYLKEKGVKKTLFNIHKKRTLDNFRNSYHLIGEFYTKCKNLDAVFIGSDEVFSIEPGLNTFFWGMGVPAKNIFAYAGCFGPTTLQEIEKRRAQGYIKAGIENFDRISVRDENSRSIIKNISNKDVEQVCDPVILYGFSKEKKSFRRKIKEKYLVVYAYDNSMNDVKEVEAIKKYCKKYNMKVVSVGFYHSWCEENINVNPFELLEYIYYAEKVVTDTFHGAVMSMIMEKEFTVKIRNNRNKLGFLLHEYQLENEIQDFKNLEYVLNKKIDYRVVNKIINQKRVQGTNFIKECIDGAINERKY